MKKILSFALPLILLSLTACVGSTPTSATPAPPTPAPELTVGETYPSGKAELTLKGVVLLDAVIDENMGWDAEEGTDYLCAIYNLRNVGTSADDVIPEEVIHSQVIYNGQYEYEELDLDIAGHGNAYSGYTPIPPLMDFTLYSIFQLPAEAAENCGAIVLHCQLGETTYTFSGAENAVAYQQEIMALADDFADGYNGLMDAAGAIFPDAQEIRAAYTAAREQFSAVAEGLSDLTPPSFYQEGYDSMVRIVDAWSELVTYTCEHMGSTDAELGQAMSGGTALIDADETDAWLESARENMPFLADTQFRTL